MTGRSVGYVVVLSAEPQPDDLRYARPVSIQVLRALWSEPRAPHAAGPRPRDWALVAVIAVAAFLETALRDDLVWRLASLAVALLVVGVLP